MAPQCEQCNSRSVVYDRSLGGRTVCAICGAPVSDTKRKPKWRRNNYTQITPGRWRQRCSVKTAIAWLLPICLVGCYLYLMANPRAVSHWLAPYSPSSRNAWWIKTPADIELLIGQAQQADRETVEQSVHGTMRELISRLQEKGVRLLISENVVEHAGGEWDPGMAEIRIRPSTVTMGNRVLAEALAHETAHVSQSCRAGGLGKNSEPMGIKVNTAEVFKHQLGSPLYKGPPSSKAIELEAFSVGVNPPWAIQLLDYFCRG
jgi:hypothetical protein